MLEAIAIIVLFRILRSNDLQQFKLKGLFHPASLARVVS